MKTAQTSGPDAVCIILETIRRDRDVSLDIRESRRNELGRSRNIRKGGRTVQDGVPDTRRGIRLVRDCVASIPTISRNEPGGFPRTRHPDRNVADAFSSTGKAARNEPEAVPNTGNLGRVCKLAGSHGGACRSAHACALTAHAETRDGATRSTNYQHAMESIMHFELAGRAGAPKVRTHASPGQRPGYRVKKTDKALRGRHHIGAPFQGFVQDARFSQGVALGWYGAGPLALKTICFRQFAIRA